MKNLSFNLRSTGSKFVEESYFNMLFILNEQIHVDRNLYSTAQKSKILKKIMKTTILEGERT